MTLAPLHIAFADLGLPFAKGFAKDAALQA